MGFATVISLRWPVAIQGVLVIRTSLGAMLLRPISLMKALTVTGSVPMKEGIDSVFWARDWPAASVNTQAKSLDSLTKVENEVLLSALAASSTAEIIRRHRISKVTTSKASLFGGAHVCGMGHSLLSDGDADVAAGELLESTTRTDYQSRFALLHNRRPGETLTGDQRVTVINSRRMEVLDLRKVDGPFALDGMRSRTRRCPAGQRLIADPDARADPHIDDLNVGCRGRPREGLN